MLRTYCADFHIHSRYSAATAESMVIPEIARQAKLKGLDIMAAGDALHPEWLKHIKKELMQTGEGGYIYPKNNTFFFVTTEIEDVHTVHHISFFPSIEAAEEVREALYKHSPDMDKDGRARVNLEAPEIVDAVVAVDGMIGPAHAFTPWTSMYKSHNSLKECYGDAIKHVKFLELGLSADTNMADRIEELQDLTFLSNSDSHSPNPNKMGREFNKIFIEGPTYDELKLLFDKKGGRKVVLNAGLDPREGKYHASACYNCFTSFTFEEAKAQKWRCNQCGKTIKKGVRDRIEELATWKEPQHPKHRPEYLHLVPLAEIICLAHGVKGVFTKDVQEAWNALVSKFGTEINVLLEADLKQVEALTDSRLARVLQLLREKKINYIPGGGGKYGEPVIDKALLPQERKQRTLAEF